MTETFEQMYKNQNTSRGTGQVNRKGRWIKIVIFLLGLVLIAQIVYYGVIAPRLIVQKVHIQGLYSLTEQEVLSAAGIVPGMMYQDLNLELMAAGIEKIPQILAAEVVRVFPNQLSIHLTIREQIATVLFQGSYFAIDENGVLFPQLESAGYQGPILSGLPFTENAGQLSVSHRYRVFIQDLHSLQLHEPGLSRIFSQFVFEPIEPGGFQVYVYPVHVQQRVLVGDRFSREQGIALLRVLELLREREDFNLVREIDFRTGDVVYTRAGSGS